jgi:predicted RNase H-like nuclease (RuvC/YqgF family)
LEAAENKLGQVLDDRKVLRGELQNMAVNQEQTNNRLMEVERQANNLRAALEEKDEQIEHLTEAIHQMREGQEVYVPTKGDYVDNAIADFINGNSNARSLRLLFIRETEGVYQFGTKRIFIKLEAGKILLRVGGGFLTIDEFIDQYAPLEMEKLARNDPVKRLSQNIAVNKSLIGKCVNQMEKSKNQVYEYRGDASGMKLLGGSPGGRHSPVGRHNSVNY